MSVARSLIAVTILGSLSAFAQDDFETLRLLRFESESEYKEYTAWIEDLENVRFAVVSNGQKWSPDVESWVKEFIQSPAKVESNEDIYLITYAEGGLSKGFAVDYLGVITSAYQTRVSRLASKEWEAEEQELRDQLAALEQERMSRGWIRPIESMKDELVELEVRLLEARLEVAQAEARVNVVMEHAQAKSPDASPSEAEEKEIALLERQYEAAKAKLARVQQLRGAGRLGGEGEVEQATLEVLKIEAELVKAKAKLRASRRPLDTDLRKMLIESESERASALALQSVLEERATDLREAIIQTTEFDAKIDAVHKQLREFDGPRMVRRANSIPRTMGPITISPQE